MCTSIAARGEKTEKERVYKKLKERETSHMFCLIKAEEDKRSDP